MQKFRQSSIVFEKPGIFLKNWKLWQAPITMEFHKFGWNFVYVFYLPMSIKEPSGIFLFCLDLELLAKIWKDLVSTHSQIPVPIAQDLNKIKKTEHPFAEIGK